MSQCLKGGRRGEGTKYKFVFCLYMHMLSHVHSRIIIIKLYSTDKEMDDTNEGLHQIKDSALMV